MAEQEIPPISSCDVQEGVAISYTERPPKQDNGVYVFTAIAVMTAYGLLLMISIRYIKVVVIPAIILVFVGALWGKFWVKARSQHDENETENLGNDTEKAATLLPMVVLSYCLQLMQLDLRFLSDLTNGQQNDDFVISHFLLFFSSTIGALAMMMAILQIGISPGVAQARQALHMTFTVILAITVHTMATEWVEEDMLLVCMPELIAVLVWFTSYFDHARLTVPSIDRVTSRESSAILLRDIVFMTLVAFLSFMFAYIDVNYEKVLAKYLYTRVLCSCTLSGILSYFSVWMIHQWPGAGSTGSAKVPIQHLRFCEKICLCISVSMLPVQLYLFRDTLPASFTAALRGLLRGLYELRVLGILVLATSFMYMSTLYRALRTVKVQATMGTDKIKFLLISSCLLVMLVQCLMQNAMMYYVIISM